MLYKNNILPGNNNIEVAALHTVKIVFIPVANTRNRDKYLRNRFIWHDCQKPYTLFFF